MPQSVDNKAPLIIWRLVDGKPGHENQTLGLANAMRRVCEREQRPCTVCDIPVNRQQAGPIAYLQRKFPAGEDLPAPDFILAAGSGTHWSLLCAKRCYGGKTVVLMKPSLPVSWFDWVVAPEHDAVSGKNVISTKGVLNPMQPGEKVPGSVLVLVGGESKHFEWDDDYMMSVFQRCLNVFPQLRITNSRRTPAKLNGYLSAVPDIIFLPYEDCPSGWLAGQLAITECVLVTSDSVSMIYEALTAGCTTALIELPPKKEGRLARGLMSLKEGGYLLSLDELLQVGGRRSVMRINESERIASKLLT
ncbi:MAG: mitochondrial fission ELM1 family protein [Moraxellaceae bacterium]|nr:mitochondrial fission ELM1 family protein [Moraxellaceae bacterium]MDZ4386741.1 mitochondrial fission ELM1 family protein [Moraxellaceae bacterium]